MAPTPQGRSVVYVSEIGTKSLQRQKNVSKRAGIYPIIIATNTLQVTGLLTGNEAILRLSQPYELRYKQTTKGSGALAQSILIVVPWLWDK